MKSISDKNYKAMINNCIDNAVVQLEIIRNIMLEEDIKYTPIGQSEEEDTNEEKPKAKVITPYDKVKQGCLEAGIAFRG